MTTAFTPGPYHQSDVDPKDIIVDTCPETNQQFAPGDRVELHPATDLWMRGARYATVKRIWGNVAVIRLDNHNVKKLQRCPFELLRPVK